MEALVQKAARPAGAHSSERCQVVFLFLHLAPCPFCPLTLTTTTSRSNPTISSLSKVRMPKVVVIFCFRACGRSFLIFFGGVPCSITGVMARRTPTTSCSTAAACTAEDGIHPSGIFPLWRALASRTFPSASLCRTPPHRRHLAVSCAGRWKVLFFPSTFCDCCVTLLISRLDLSSCSLSVGF